MGRHTFNFAGGEELTTMGATWFVSYAYYTDIDNTHTNWKNVSTYKGRASVFNRTTEYHTRWLIEVITMSDNRLNTNEIGLEASRVKEMAKELLIKRK